LAVAYEPDLASTIGINDGGCAETFFWMGGEME
jgi:hypothetical protein